MGRTNSRTTSPCPRCGRPVEVEGRPLVGELVDCRPCGAHLEVVEVAPLRLGPAARVEEVEDA